MTMKSLIVVLTSCVCALHLTQAYDSKFDVVDIEGIIAHDYVHRMVNNCLLQVIDCGPFWSEVRVMAKDISKSNCAKCTPRQKAIVKTYAEATKKKYPEVWKQIRYTFKNSDS